MGPPSRHDHGTTRRLETGPRRGTLFKSRKMEKSVAGAVVSVGWSRSDREQSKACGQAWSGVVKRSDDVLEPIQIYHWKAPFSRRRLPGPGQRIERLCRLGDLEPWWLKLRRRRSIPLGSDPEVDVEEPLLSPRPLQPGRPALVVG